MPLSAEQKQEFRRQLAAERNQLIGMWVSRWILVILAVAALGMKPLASLLTSIGTIPFGLASDVGTSVGLPGTAGRQIQQANKALQNIGPMTLEDRENSSLPPVGNQR